jgi:hypothetical protein
MHADGCQCMWVSACKKRLRDSEIWAAEKKGVPPLLPFQSHLEGLEGNEKRVPLTDLGSFPPVPAGTYWRYRRPSRHQVALAQHDSQYPWRSRADGANLLLFRRLLFDWR